MNLFSLPLTSLFFYGVHIGHSKKNTLWGAAWMIHSFRQLLTIIDLLLTVRLLKIIFFFISNVVTFLGPIWFVNSSPLAKRIVRACASLCGEFSVTSEWISGALSNFFTIFLKYRLTSRKSRLILSSRDKSFDDFYVDWHLSRFIRPRAVFLSNMEGSYFVVKESLFSNIGSLGVVDTNISSQGLSLPMPGNDESVICLTLYNDLIANYVMFKKYSLVMMWFVNIRSSSRIVSFFNWLREYYASTEKPEFSVFKAFNMSSNLSMNNNFSKGSSLFFSRDVVGYNSVVEKIVVEKSGYNFSNSDLIALSDNILRRRVFFNKVLNLNFVSKMLSLRNSIIDNRFLSLSNFKRVFLKTSWILRRFARDTFALGKLNFRHKIKIKNADTVKKKYFLMNIFFRLYFFLKYRKHFSIKDTFKKSFVMIIYQHYFYRLVRRLLKRHFKFTSIKRTWKKQIKRSPLKYRNFLYYWRHLEGLFDSPYGSSVQAAGDGVLYYKKSFDALKNNKLKFYVSNVSFDDFIKGSYVWNVNTLLPTAKSFSEGISGFSRYFFVFNLHNRELRNININSTLNFLNVKVSKKLVGVSSNKVSDVLWKWS